MYGQYDTSSLQAKVIHLYSLVLFGMVCLELKPGKWLKYESGMEKPITESTD